MQYIKENKPIPTQSFTFNIKKENDSFERWIVEYSATKSGLYICNVYALFNSTKDKHKNLHISGSPFVIRIYEGYFNKNKFFFNFLEKSFNIHQDIPSGYYIPLIDFIQAVPVGIAEPLYDEVKIEEHRQRLHERIEKLGIVGERLDQSQRDPRCLMKALSELLYGSDKNYIFIRKSIAGWLMNHGDFSLV